MTTTALTSALNAAQHFDPWETVSDDADPLPSPEDFIAPERPPADSSFAVLPDTNHHTPWARDISTSESTGSYNAFRHYLALGPSRTLRRVSEDLEAGYSAISRLASNHNWVSRAAAWDAYQNEEYDKVLVEKVHEMAGRHAQVFSSALEGLSLVFQPFSDPELLADELSDLPVKSRLQLAIQAAKAMPGLAAAERLALGMPTEIKQESHHHTVQYEATLTDIKGILVGLHEANVSEKISSRDKDIIDVEPIEDDDE